MNLQLTIFSVLLAFSCGNVSSQVPIHECTLVHDGITREYEINIPESYDVSNSVPLVLCFHGYTSSAKTIKRYSGFDKLSEDNGFIVVYPQGTKLRGKTHWNVGGWTTESTVDDVEFIEALIEDLSKKYSIDQKRIYSTGMSNGGYMSFLLACQLSNKIAAIASVTGSMTPESFRDCSPEHPTPVMQFHGTKDKKVPYDGATWTKSISDVLSYWMNFNKTNSDPIWNQIEDIDTSDGSTAEIYSYLNGENQSTVIHYKILGGGHDWFGSWGNKDVRASDLIWDFFSNYNLDGKIGD